MFFIPLLFQITFLLIRNRQSWFFKFLGYSKELKMNLMLGKEIKTDIKKKEVSREYDEHASSAPQRINRQIVVENVELAGSQARFQENIEDKNVSIGDSQIKVEILQFESEQLSENDEDINKDNKIASIPQQQKDGLKECQFCAQLLNEEQMAKNFNCHHTFCKDCLIQYFYSKIDQFKIIRCPNEQCQSELIEQSELMNDLPQNFKLKYDEIKFRAMVEAKGENFRFCSNEKCTRGIVQVKQKGKKGICHKCNMVVCLKCMMAEHSGKCEGIEINMLKDRFKYKRCVKCKMIVERNQGCPHMTCKCGAQFCYNCGSAWGSNHYCLRNRISGDLITDKLHKNLKFLRCSQHEYDQSFTGFVCRIPYYVVFLILMLLWATWCTVYGVIMFSLMLVASLLAGQIFLIYKLYRQCSYSGPLNKFILVIAIVLFPVMMPFTGLVLWIVLIAEVGGKHFLFPAAGGTAFPIFKKFCK